MANKSKHVAPSATGGWVVRTYGSTRATRKFPTQQEALSFGRDLAIRHSRDLYIHGQDGGVREKLSYRAAAIDKQGK
jgi:hypothetical protein